MRLPKIKLSKLKFDKRALTAVLVSILIVLTVVINLTHNQVNAATNSWGFGGDLTGYDYDAAKVNIASSKASLTNPGTVAGANLNLNPRSSVTSDGAAQFTSANKDYLSIASNASLQTGDIDFELGAWVYLDVLGTEKGIISKYADINGVNEYNFYVGSDNKPYLMVSGNGTAKTYLASTTTLSISTWYFIRGWHDSVNNKLKIQVNNGTIDETAHSTGCFVSSNDFRIGAWAGSTGVPMAFMNGRIDSAYIKKSISTTDEATALYNAGAGRAYSGLTAANGLDSFASGLTSWWDLNEESGTRYDAKGANNLTSTAVKLIDPATYGSEMVTTNAGFETAGGGGADVFGTWTEVAGSGTIADETTLYHGGAHAAKLTYGTGTSYVYQNLTVTAGSVYYVAAWTRGDGAVGGGYRIWDNTNGAWVVSNGSTGIAGTTYLLFSTTFTAPANCVSARILFYSPSSAGSAYFDDASVKNVTYAGLLNGGLDTWTSVTDAATWVESVSGTSTVNDEQTAPYSGSHAARLDVDAGGDIVGISQSAGMTIGKKYKYSFYAKADSGTPTIAALSSGVSTQTTFTLSTSYVQYTGYFTADAQAILLKRGSASGRSIFIDSVTLESIGPLCNTGIAAGTSLSGDYAAGFDGTSQYLSKTDPATLRAGDIDFEIGGWIYMDNLGGPSGAAVGTLISKGNPGVSGGEYSLWVRNNGAIYFNARQADNADYTYDNTGVGVVSPSTWAFIRAWHDHTANTLNVQVNNGAVVSKAFADGGVYSGTNTITVGRYLTNSTFTNGRVDNLYFRKAISSSDEATALYNAGKGLRYANLPASVKNDANLTSYWDMDEKTGTRYDSTSIHNDLADTGTTSQARGVNFYDSAVSKIADLSGNAKNFTQTTQTLRPEYDSLGINNTPAMQFDGVDDTLVKTSDQIGTGNISMTAVIKPRSVGGTCGRVLDNSKFIVCYQAGYIAVISDGSTIARSANSSIADGNSYVIAVTRTSAGVANIYINGALSGTANQSSGTPATGTDTYIGNSSAGTRMWDGWIGPVMTFGSILGDSERNQIEKSLGATYGVTVASTASTATASIYPTLSTKAPLHYTSMSAFAESLGAGSAGTIRYQVSNDPTQTDINSATWYWWNGASWAAADKNNAWQGNTAAEINSNISTFHNISPANNFKWRAFLVTDGVDNPILSTVDMTYIADSEAPALTTLSGALGITNNQGTIINSGQWSHYTNPSFSWNVPADPSTVPGEQSSGVAGYLVYWGTDNTANIDSASVVVGADRVGYRWQTGTTYTSAITLVTGSTYYLKVIPVDNAGNAHMTATPTDYNLFTYKYDNVVPTAPLYTSVTPSGYTKTNHFVFNWPVVGGSAATDSGGSGLAKYQYRIGTSGDWHDVTGDGATSSITLDDAAALGLNTFNLVAVDAAGNQSGSVRTNFYYNNTAPTAPPNLRVNPETPSATNSFSFSWDTPPGEIAGYYYSVNAIPTLENASFTASTSLTAGPYATQQGANIMYVVAKDNAGNYDFSGCSQASVGYNPNNGDTCAAVAFTANTTAPGIPGGVEAYDISVRDTSEYTVAIKYHVPTDAGTGFAGYDIYRSTDNSTFAKVGTTTSTTYLDDSLSSQLYYYYVVAKDNAGQYSASSSTVSITPTGKYTSPANLVSGPTFTINPTSIEVRWATDRVCSSFVSVRSGGIFVSEQGESTQVTDHLVKVVGLKAQQEYTFNIRSTDIDGNTLVGADQVFSTQNNPSVYDLSVDNVTQTSAIVNFKSTAIANFILYYGETANFGRKIVEDSSSSTSNHSLALSGLLSGTKYYFRVSGSDAEGNELRSENSFDTLPMPKITKFAIEPIADAPSTSLKVVWESNVGITTVLKYSVDGTNFSEKTLSDLVTDHTVSISDLVDQKTYTLYATGRDQFGNVAESDRVTFDTPKDSRPPKISDVIIESSNVGNQSDTKAQVAISWKTDELSTSQVEYGDGISGTEYTSKTTLDSSLTNHHLVIISGLDPSKPYHMRVVSADGGGNVSNSGDNTVITGDVSHSVLQLIMSTLTSIFGWMGKLIR